MQRIYDSMWNAYIDIIQATIKSGWKLHESNMREILTRQSCSCFLHYTKNSWARAEMDLYKLVISLNCFRRVKKRYWISEGLSIWPLHEQCLMCWESQKPPIALVPLQRHFDLQDSNKKKKKFYRRRSSTASTWLVIRLLFKIFHWITIQWEGFAWFYNKAERLEVGFSVSGSRVEFAPNWRVQILRATMDGWVVKNTLKLFFSS